MSRTNAMSRNPEPENLEPSAGKEDSDNVLQLAQELIQALDVQSNEHMEHVRAQAKLVENTESS
jgi:hypothetical protein